MKILDFDFLNSYFRLRHSETSASRPPPSALLPIISLHHNHSRHAWASGIAIAIRAMETAMIINDCAGFGIGRHGETKFIAIAQTAGRHIVGIK